MRRVDDRPGDWSGIFYETNADGRQARFRVIAHGGGERKSEWFSLSTPLKKMQDWRKDAAAALHTKRKPRASRGTFEGDARRYLRAVTNLDDYRTRVQHIEEWIAIFGTRRRESIRAADIREQRNRWLEQPYAFKQTRRRLARGVDPHILDGAGERIPLFYSASAINQRLRALSNLWTVLEPDAPNPVRHVPEVEEPEPVARGIPREDVERIFAHIPDRGWPEKRGAPRPPYSIAKWWLRALYYGGLTHAQLERVDPETEIDWDNAAFRTKRRRKGKGVRGDWKPIMKEGMIALWMLQACGALGRKRSSTAPRRAFIRAAKAAGYEGKFTPYDLRASFAGWMFETTRDKQLVQMLLQHGDDRTTDRYMETAKFRVLKRAVDEAAQAEPPENRRTPFPNAAPETTPDLSRVFETGPGSTAARLKRRGA